MGIDADVTSSTDLYKFKASKISKFKESVDKSTFLIPNKFFMFINFPLISSGMNLQICFINEKADGFSDLENKIGNGISIF